MAERNTTSEPIPALYVHVPFCHTICGYCDFYSTVLDRSAVGPLVDALLAELSIRQAGHALACETIFVGGGTPTTIAPSELRRLLTALRATASASLEFTVEANPATVSPEVADTLAGSGVNRVSIGAQSFDRSELRILERIHEPQQVAQTLENCRRAGIENLNVDLIFAVPGQTLEGWLANLRAALALEPRHLSCYGLTFERGTPLYEQLQSGEVKRLDAELEAEMYEATIDTLAAAGLRQYEISNFAQPGFECRHSLVYWNNRQHVGLGPSAAGLVGETRYKNIADTAEYARSLRAGRLPVIQQERLSPEQRARESMMLGLRLIEGVDRATFEHRFGRDPAELFAEPLARFIELGLTETTQSAVRLTRRGLLVADSVMAEFL